MARGARFLAKIDLAHSDLDGDALGDERDGFDGRLTPPTPVVASRSSQFSRCRSLRRGDFADLQEGVRALADALADFDFEPAFDGAWEDLLGCLDTPCDLSVDPTLVSAGRAWAEAALERGLGTRGLFLGFLDAHVLNDRTLDERTNFIEWRFETSGGERLA